MLFQIYTLKNIVVRRSLEIGVRSTIEIHGAFGGIGYGNESTDINDFINKHLSAKSKVINVYFACLEDGKDQPFHQDGMCDIKGEIKYHKISDQFSMDVGGVLSKKNWDQMIDDFKNTDKNLCIEVENITGELNHSSNHETNADVTLSLKSYSFSIHHDIKKLSSEECSR